MFNPYKNKIRKMGKKILKYLFIQKVDKHKFKNNNKNKNQEKKSLRIFL